MVQITLIRSLMWATDNSVTLRSRKGGRARRLKPTLLDFPVRFPTTSILGLQRCILLAGPLFRASAKGTPTPFFGAAQK